MQMEQIGLEHLVPHPRNSNVMSERLLSKLTAHIERTDRYPPIIVRPFPGSEIRDQRSEIAYQILDGHHRVEALKRLNCDSARCVVWDVDDEEALVLLATLNRLQGSDDPRKRAALVTELSQRMDFKAMTGRLPEQAEQLKHLLALHREWPAPRRPQTLERMPLAVHFFLLPEQRTTLERKLKTIGGTREQALMTLVESTP